MTSTLSRRNFLRATAALGAAVTVGFDANDTLAAATKPGGNITPFVKIYPDGTVAAIIKHFEGG
jgi:isoquinoline 1-oxidoreductase subunit beta